MKTVNSENFQPNILKPRSFSQTNSAPRISGGSTTRSVSSGTTGRTTGPLSVPRSGCCGK